MNPLVSKGKDSNTLAPYNLLRPSRLLSGN